MWSGRDDDDVHKQQTMLSFMFFGELLGCVFQCRLNLINLAFVFCFFALPGRLLKPEWLAAVACATSSDTDGWVLR